MPAVGKEASRWCIDIHNLVRILAQVYALAIKKYRQLVWYVLLQTWINFVFSLLSNTSQESAMEQLSVFGGGEVPAVGKEASRWPTPQHADIDS